jgi:hypothetical protein
LGIIYKYIQKTLIIIITTIFVFTSMMLMDQYTKIMEHQRISNNFYTENTVVFEGSLSEDTINEIPAHFSDYGLILYKTIDPSEKLRVVISSDDFVHPDLTEGRFFQMGDFFSESHYAVVGIKIFDSLEGEARSRYYIHGGLEYEVIGVIGYERDTLLDDTVFLAANHKNIENLGYYSVDGTKRSEVHSFIENQTLVSNVEIIDKEFVSAGRILGFQALDSTMIIAVLAIIFIIVFGYIVMVTFWIRKNYKEFFVRRMCGHKLHYIIFEFLKRLLIYNAIGLSLGLITYMVYKNFNSINSNTIVVIGISTYLTTASMNLILLTGAFVGKRKIPIYDKLK